MTTMARIEDGPVATVYSGFKDGVPVALKVFPKRFDKRTMSAFTKEQNRLATVRRVTSILMVDGVEEMPSGEPALRMELCTQSLTGLVERVGPLAASDVIVLGRAVAIALAAAHGAGVIHGGIAPNNVLFRGNGEPVVGDFGVTLRQAFTRDPLHAIEYLPPETLRTGTLDESTDLYGLGAVLHFALSSRSPHPGRLGEQPGERVLRILGEPVPAVNRPDVPVQLSTVVARLLASTPDRRPSSAAQVADQLTALLPNPPKPATPEDWDDFDTPAPPPAMPLAPRRPQQPPPEDDFDDFAPQHHRPAPPRRPMPQMPPRPATVPPPVAAPPAPEKPTEPAAVAQPAPEKVAEPADQPKPDQQVTLPEPAKVAPPSEPTPVAKSEAAPPTPLPLAALTAAPTQHDGVLRPDAPSPPPVAPAPGSPPAALPPAPASPVAPPPPAPPAASMPATTPPPQAAHTEAFPAPPTVDFAAQRHPGLVIPRPDTEDDFADFADPARPRGRAKVLAGPLAPPGQTPKRLIRYDLLAGAAIVLALLALVPLLLLRGDPEEMSSSPQLPPAADTNPRNVTVELGELTDLTDKVQLTWKATRDLDFAVVVAPEGEMNRVLLAERNRSMTVEVKPGLKYCFSVQATDGDQVYESDPVPLRGATCKRR